MKLFKLTRELAKKEALQYPSRIKLKASRPTLYRIAQQNGWLDYICAHMTHSLSSNRKSKVKWFYQSCKKEGKNHYNRVSFKKDARGCYDVCERNGWLPEVCKHMDSPMEMREKKLQHRLHQKLKKTHPDLIIELEYKVPLNSRKNGRIDFLLTHIITKKSIAFELKHSKSKWSKPELSSQKKSYKRAFKEKKKFQGVYFICDTDKYGIPLNQIDSLIKQIY